MPSYETVKSTRQTLDGLNPKVNRIESRPWNSNSNRIVKWHPVKDQGSGTKVSMSSHWFCDDCAKYGAVGLVPAPEGGSESSINAIQASHRAVSPDCEGRRLAVCALQTLDLTD